MLTTRQWAESILLADCPYEDLTTVGLGIEETCGTVSASLKAPGIAAGIDLFAAHRYQMHGDVLGACQLAQLKLPRLAYIKQNRFGPCIVGQPGGKLLYANLLHQKVKLSLAPTPSSAGMTVSKRLTVL